MNEAPFCPDDSIQFVQDMISLKAAEKGVKIETKVLDNLPPLQDFKSLNGRILERKSIRSNNRLLG